MQPDQGQGKQLSCKDHFLQPCTQNPMGSRHCKKPGALSSTSRCSMKEASLVCLWSPVPDTSLPLKLSALE